MDTTADTTSFRRYTDLASLAGILSSSSLTLLDPTTWDDRNDGRYLSIYKERLKLTSVLALCFSQAAETYHHWKVFAPGSTGVCIVLNANLLLMSIAKVPDVQGGEVHYLKLDNVRQVSLGVNALPFAKRYGYQPEEEYRVLYSSATEERYVFTGYGNAASRNIKPAVMDGLRAQARASISR